MRSCPPKLGKWSLEKGGELLEISLWPHSFPTGWGSGQAVYTSSYEVLANKLLCSKHVSSLQIELVVGKWPRSQKRTVMNGSRILWLVPMGSSGSYTGFQGPQPWGWIEIDSNSTLICRGHPAGHWRLGMGDTWKRENGTEGLGFQGWFGVWFKEEARTAVLELLRSTCRSSDSLGGLTELRRAVVLMVPVHRSGRKEKKISRRDSCIGQDPGETRRKLPVVLSHQRHGDSTSLFPATLCDNIERVLPAREAHPRPWCHGWPWLSALPEVKLMLFGPRPPAYITLLA